MTPKDYVVKSWQDGSCALPANSRTAR
jgi:hypothetical protein